MARPRARSPSPQSSLPLFDLTSFSSFTVSIPSQQTVTCRQSSVGAEQGQKDSSSERRDAEQKADERGEKQAANAVSSLSTTRGKGR